MLQATFYPGGELSRIGPDRIKPTGPQQIKGPARITDGPQIQAGPFTLPANVDLSTKKLYVLKNQLNTSRLHRALADWAVDAIWQVSQKQHWENPNYGFSKWKAGPRSATAPFAVDGKSLWAKSRFSPMAPLGYANKPNPIGKDQILYPRFDQSDGVHDVNVGGYWVSAPGLPGNIRGVGCVLVPDNQVWGVAYFTGKKPIGRFQHPVTKKDWGIYCLITGNGFEFTFKKIEYAWYQDIWNWIKNLAAELIEFVSDLVNFLKDMVACPLARQYLDNLSTIAAQSTHVLTIEQRKDLLKFLQKGDPTLTYDDLADFETGAQADAIKATADRIITKVCGAAPQTTKQYPAGAVQAFDPGSKQWIIAVPKNKSLSGGLGVNPETGEQYEVIDKTSGKAVTVVAISFDELKKWLRPPWYSPRSPWFWGGLAALGTSGYVGWRVLRKRRA